MKQSTSARKAFKDYFDHEAADALGSQVKGAWKDFDVPSFVKLATTGLDTLEFHARVSHFAAALQQSLPQKVGDALSVLTMSLPEPQSDCESPGDGWILWPLGQFIAEYGLEDIEASIAAMIALTQRFSAEFAVRPFIEQHPDRMFALFEELKTHPNPHVRRWCSEGIRTRLPWGRKLHALISDPTPIWPILEALKDDEELYVRRSVANNVNDIAKDHPEVVIERCRQWSRNSNERRDWVIRHALRTLFKDGHPEALNLLGFHHPENVVCIFSMEPKIIEIGQGVEMDLTVENRHLEDQRLMIDYAVHYVRKGGQQSRKVFKWKEVQLKAGETITLTKKHPMKVTTVRALYPGRHQIDIQVNGNCLAGAAFDLT